MFEFVAGNSVSFFESSFMAKQGVKAIITSRNDKFINEKKFKTNLYNQFNLNYKEIIQPQQVHSSAVLILKNEKFYNKNQPIAADAVITNIDNFTLQALFADCVPIFYFHRESGLRALVHSGWRGTGKSIAAAVLQQVKLYYDVNIKDIYVTIGPAISQKHYEVDNQVYKYFRKYSPELLLNYEERIFRNSDVNFEKYYLDLKMANYYILLQAGVDPEKIYVSDSCTYSNPRFCSYRREGEQTGRMIALLMSEEVQRMK